MNDNPSKEQIAEAGKITDLASALINTIAKAGGGELGAEFEIDNVFAIEALIAAMAMLLDADPNVRTARDMRLMGEWVGKALHRRLQQVRKLSEELGHPTLQGLGQLKGAHATH